MWWGQSPALTQKLQQALARFDALEALLICTSEGVPLVRGPCFNIQTVADADSS